MNDYLLTIRIHLDNRLDDVAARQEATQIVENVCQDLKNKYGSPTVKLQRLINGQAPVGVNLGQIQD